jgi:hypothetical protein
MSESKINPITDGGASVDCPLLKDEKAALLYEFGVATVTLYKGDFEQASTALRSQFGAGKFLSYTLYSIHLTMIT